MAKGPAKKCPKHLTRCGKDCCSKNQRCENANCRDQKTSTPAANTPVDGAVEAESFRIPCHPFSEICDTLDDERIRRPGHVVTDDPDACTIVFDGFFFADFRQACWAHDRCYGKCNSKRSDCDGQILADLRKACDDAYRISVLDEDGADIRKQIKKAKKKGNKKKVSQLKKQLNDILNLPNLALQACYADAAAYHVGLMACGAPNYNAAQREACVCCMENEIACGDVCCLSHLCCGGKTCCDSTQTCVQGTCQSLSYRFELEWEVTGDAYDIVADQAGHVTVAFETPQETYLWRYSSLGEPLAQFDNSIFWESAEDEYGPGYLDFRGHLATDLAGNVYIAYGRAMYKITPEGARGWAWYEELYEEYFDYPGPDVFTIDSENHVVCALHQRIARYTIDEDVPPLNPSGGVRPPFPDVEGNLVTGSEIRLPSGFHTGGGENLSMAAGLDGEIYLRNYKRVLGYAGNGSTIVDIQGEGSGPGQFESWIEGERWWWGQVATDRDGFVYVGDPGNYRVQKFDPQGNFVTMFGVRGTAPGQFEGAVALAVDGFGAVYVLDRGRMRVLKFVPNEL